MVFFPVPHIKRFYYIFLGITHNNIDAGIYFVIIIFKVSKCKLESRQPCLFCLFTAIFPASVEYLQTNKLSQGHPQAITLRPASRLYRQSKE